MTQFLEELRTRMEQAHKRLQAAAVGLQQAQALHAAANQEFGSLQHLYQLEVRRSQGVATPASPALSTNAGQVVAVSVSTPSAERSDNKTEIVRQLLQEHPNGMTPGELWKAVNGRIKHRAYLYSVLKRLFDRDDAFKRRGKYFPKVLAKSEEGKDHYTVQ